jgi:hypothetical protein
MQKGERSTERATDTERQRDKETQKEIDTERGQGDDGKGEGFYLRLRLGQSELFQGRGTLSGPK